jgi:hypothetical protein
LALIVMMPGLLATSVAFVRLMIEIGGRGRATLVLSAAFVLSPVALISVTWWGIMTTVFAGYGFGISAFACVLRWQRTRHWKYLISLAVSYSLSLAFWEKGLLVPLYIAVFVVARCLAQHRSHKTLIRMWQPAVVLAVPAIIHASIYFSGTYIEQAGDAPATSKLASFLIRSVTLGLVPASFGFRHGVSDWNGAWAVVCALCAIPLILFIVFTIRRSRSSVWAWIFCAVTIIGNRVVLGRGRVAPFGVDIGYDFRYQFDSPLLLLVAAAFAISTSPSRLRVRTNDGVVSLAPGVLRRLVFAAGLAAGALFVIGSIPTISSCWQFNLGQSAGKYFSSSRSCAHAVTAKGTQWTLADSYVRSPDIPPACVPYNLWSVSGPLFSRDLRIATTTQNLYTVGPTGALTPRTSTCSPLRIRLVKWPFVTAPAWLPQCFNCRWVSIECRRTADIC